MYEQQYPTPSAPSVTVQCSLSVHPVAECDYVPDAWAADANVPPGPVAEFLAAAISKDATRCKVARRAIVDDERYAPIHLVRLVAAVDYAVRQVGGTASALLFNPVINALHSGGLPAATNAARTMTADEQIAMLNQVQQVWAAFLDEATTGELWSNLPPRR